MVKFTEILQVVLTIQVRGNIGGGEKKKMVRASKKTPAESTQSFLGQRDPCLDERPFWWRIQPFSRWCSEGPKCVGGGEQGEE